MGALTSKPYAFTARPWELRNIETVDIGDTECVPVRVQLKGNQILRVLPLLKNNYAKCDWISDRTRFGYDGFFNQRVNNINYIDYFSTGRNKGNVEPLIWIPVFDFLTQFFHINLVKFLFVIQRKLSVQEWNILDRTASLRADSVTVFSQVNETYSFSNDLVPSFSLPQAYQKAQQSDLVITIGLNLREQFPIFYSLLRQRFLSGIDFDYYYIMSDTIQSHVDSDFGINLGNSLDVFWKILAGKHPVTKKFLIGQRPLILVGGTVTLNSYFLNFMASLYVYTNKLSKFTGIHFTVGLLTTDVNHFGAHYYGIGLENCRNYWQPNHKNILTEQISRTSGFNKNNAHASVIPFTLFYSVGSLKSTSFTNGVDFLATDFIVEHSSHYSPECGFLTSNLIIPDFSFFEKSGFYYNFEGFGQFTSTLINSGNNIHGSQKLISLNSALTAFEPFNGKNEAFLHVLDSSSSLVDFSQSLLNCMFVKTNTYNSQTWLRNFFWNPISSYDYLMCDSLSINSPTLNLMKQVSIRSQLNFVN